MSEQERLEALLQDISIQWNTLQQHIEKHQELIPPIHNIPVEILQIIFHYCLPSDHNAIMSVHEVPLLLGHVCRAWRQLSHSTPQLWSTIHINHPTFTAPFEWYCQAVEAWLHRSSGLPLSVSLADTCGGPTLLRMLIQTLFKFSPRWKHLALNFKSYYSFGGVKAVNAPILTAAIIDIQGSPKEEALAALSFLHTSSLRSVSVPYISALTLFRWENITDLSMGSPEEADLISVERALEIFRACPNLASCTFEMDIDRSCDVDVINLLRLHTLRLVLYMSSPVHHIPPLITTFLGALDMPNLNHLEFKTVYETTLVVPFKPLLERLHCLTILEYAVSDVPADKIAAALALSPSLRYLRLAVDFTVEDTTSLPGTSLSCALLALLHAHAQTPLLPALEHLDISTDENSDITEDSLLQFILSRTDNAPSGTVRLKRIRFSFSRPRSSSTDIMQALSSAIADGLQVQIKYPIVYASGANKFRVNPREAPVMRAGRGFWDSNL